MSVPHPAPHSLTFLPKSHFEQAHVASRPQRWHLVIVGVCGGDIYGAVFHVPLELSGQEAPSACVINIIYCYKSPFWSLWPWQLEIFVTLVWAQLLCSEKRLLGQVLLLIWDWPRTVCLGWDLRVAGVVGKGNSFP